MPGDPTPRELLLQLQATARELDALGRRLDVLADNLGKSYVPRGEYEEARKGDDRRFGEVERDIENQAGFRRQVAASLIVGVLLIVAQTVVTLAVITGAIGPS